MKLDWKIIAIILLIIILAPVLVGMGVSADILNNWTNDNDWIGFWGSYVGTLLGGIITLVVLWSTLEDNKRAREREEKINYYNNLIEVTAVFFSDTGNYLAQITRFLSEKNDETYRLCIYAGNQVARSSIVFDTQLYIKKDIDNIAQIIRDIEPIEREIETFVDDVNQIMKNRGKDAKQINDLYKKTKEVVNWLNDYTEEFPKLIKAELDK